MRRRFNDEAVSAAIATVLLFAGVLGIISGMMVTITPLINEKHGSVERQAMAGQMEDLAAETVRISENGLPGDSATLQLRPHTGELGWNLAHGGTWYSVAFVDGGSFRLDGLLDLDDKTRIRYSESEVSAACFSDLRANKDATWNYRIPNISGTILATPATSLQQPLYETTVKYTSGASSSTYSLIPGSVLSTASTGESWLQSDGPLKVIFLRGTGGVTMVEPDLANPSDGKGRAWTIPMPTGSVSLHLVSSDLTTISWDSNSNSGTATSTGSPATWNGDFTTLAGDVMTVHSSSPARLMMVWGSGTGATVWPDDGGSGLGISHTLPAAAGSILIENPETTSIAVQIDGLFNTISAQSSMRISWPAVSSQIQSTGPVQIHWLAEDASNSYRTGSLEMIPATDTGRSSGLEHSYTTPTSASDESVLIQKASPETSLTLIADLEAGQSPHITVNDSTGSQLATLSPTASNLVRTAVNSTDILNDAPFRIISVAGDDGMMEIRQDGEQRCLPIGYWASGWVELNLPWDDFSHYSTAIVKDAWKDGSHPLGVEVTLLGPQNGAPHDTLAAAWGAHLPRLNYEFQSSVSGMEIGYRGGFVGTNHPEYQADVLVLPPAREGPGPRLAVTIPLTMPADSSSIGNSQVALTVSLDQRVQLVSVQAHEIRRGWDGPYGAAIAAESSQELAFSADWLTFPGRIDLLDDYVGWVQLTHSSPEAVYHASGEPIMFNLQLSQISIDTELII
uniref:Uncharacterized protein n=1 Tax=uncultured marine group II/III euryarchaeote KM3_12_E03 TaxID=1457859 RepID=A0A075G941_9EURY|nr:hypothetical protein [uncultured marine group II/III euryarchaeote KM3_12_E03]